MKKKSRRRKHNHIWEALQLERALQSLTVPVTFDLQGKELHELTFDEFKSLYAVGALEITRFNRLMHWEKFLYKTYVRGIIHALESNLSIPLAVLNANRYRIPCKFFKSYVKKNSLRQVPLEGFVKRSIPMTLKQK